MRQRADIFSGMLIAAGLLFLNILYVSSFTGLVHPPRIVLETDHYYYLEMAGGMGNYFPRRLAPQPPYCWRLLVPFLASLLRRTGLSLNLSFYLLTNLFLFLFLFVFYLYLRRTGFDRGGALLGIILVGLTPGAVRWYEYQYWMTDPAGLFFVLLALFLIESKREAYLAPLSALAVTARETYLAVFPYCFLYHLKRDGLKRAVVCIVLGLLPALLVLALIRAFIVPSKAYNLAATIKEMVAFRRECFWYNQWYLWTVGSFGVAFPLVWLFPKRFLSFCKEHYDKLVFVIIAYASLTFGNNTDRLLAYALPVFVWAALKNLTEFSRKTHLPFSLLAAAVIALQAVLYLSTEFYGQPAISVFQPPRLPVVLTLTVFWLLCQARLIFRNHK